MANRTFGVVPTVRLTRRRPGRRTEQATWFVRVRIEVQFVLVHREQRFQIDDSIRDVGQVLVVQVVSADRCRLITALRL